MALSIPLNIAVVSAQIARFTTLSAADQLRAASLVLHRDFGITGASLRLATRAIGSAADRVLIAYSTAAASTGTASPSIDFSWVPQIANGDIIWLRAGDPREESAVFSEHGVARFHGPSAGSEIPSAVVSIIAASSNETSSRSATKRVWISDIGATPIAEESLALWRASLGVEFAPLTLSNPSAPTPLLPIPATATKSEKTPLDRALVGVTVAAALCVCVSGWRYVAVVNSDVSAPSIIGQSNAARVPLNRFADQPGEMWSRSTIAAPVLTEFMKSATFGSSAWVIAAPALPPANIASVESALATNGFAAQVVREPEVRLRVQRR